MVSVRPSPYALCRWQGIAASDINYEATILLMQKRIFAVRFKMRNGSSPALTSVNDHLHPASPMWVGERYSLRIQDADAVEHSKLFDEQNPLIAFGARPFAFCAKDMCLPLRFGINFMIIFTHGCEFSARVVMNLPNSPLRHLYRPSSMVAARRAY